jgi:hypothetical protein
LPQNLPSYDGICLQCAQGYSVTGNTILNWGVCPRLRYGIHEDSASFKNVFTGNNVNYYQNGDMLCQGQRSVVRNNVGNRDKPYQSGESAGTVVQSFERELTARFIAEQLYTTTD